MELVKLLLDKGANTFNPVVLNGVSDCVVESLGEMVGEKDWYRRRGILVWHMEENDKEKEMSDCGSGGDYSPGGL